MRLLALALAFACSVAKGAPPSPSNVVVVNQSVSGPSEGVVSTVVARVGSALPSRREVTLDVDGRTILNGASVTQVPVRDYGVTRTSAQLLTDAKVFLLSAADGTAAALQSYMSANGIGVGFFTLSQKVQVVGSAAPQFLVWQLVLYANERAVFSDPVLIATANATLQIVYTPLRLPLHLPAGVVPANAGILQWRTADNAGTPLTDWTTIDVRGAYDEPDPTSGRIDPDAGLKCLLRRVAGCPATTNAQDIMSTTGLPLATVDYRRNLSVVYDTVEDPPGSGIFIQRGRISLSLTSRSLEAGPLCAGAGYVNRGNYGLTLQDQVERYRARVTGEASRIAVLAETIVVPATPYEARKVLGPADTLASLAGQIIDPSDATKLIRVADVPGLVNVPPILRGGDAGGDTLVVADYHHGRCGRAIEVRATCNAAGDIELTMGATGQVPDCQRGTDFLGSPVAVTLHAGVPVAPRWDNPPTDFAPLPIHWMFDGARVIFLPPVSDSFNPFGYRSVFTEYLFHPPEGFYLKDNFPNGGPVPFYYVAGYACPAGQFPGAEFPRADYRTTIVGRLDPALCYRVESNPPFVHDPNSVQVCKLGDSRTTTNSCSLYEATGQFATLGLKQD